MTNRGHLVPVRLSKIFPNVDTKCWRRCGDVGTMFHVFWTCKCLRCFWNGIFSLISRITGFFISPVPEMDVLHHKLGNVPKQCPFLIVQILTAACMTIASLWKSNLAPNMSETIKRVQNAAQFEKVLAYDMKSIKKCYDNWNGWLSEYPLKDF